MCSEERERRHNETDSGEKMLLMVVMTVEVIMLGGGVGVSGTYMWILQVLTTLWTSCKSDGDRW